jgi:hypothetical protein
VQAEQIQFNKAQELLPNVWSPNLPPQEEDTIFNNRQFQLGAGLAVFLAILFLSFA